MSIYDIKISLKPLSSTWVLYQLFTVPLVTLLGSWFNHRLFYLCASFCLYTLGGGGEDPNDRVYGGAPHVWVPMFWSQFLSKDGSLLEEWKIQMAPYYTKGALVGP